MDVLAASLWFLLVSLRDCSFVGGASKHWMVMIRNALKPPLQLLKTWLYISRLDQIIFDPLGQWRIWMHMAPSQQRIPSWV